MKLDEDTLQAIVEAVARRLAAEAPPEPLPAPAMDFQAPCGGDGGHACTARPRPVHAVATPVYEAMLPRLVALTSSQVAVGRAGNRFRTDLYLRAREGHADARDAVHSEVPEDWAARHGLVQLQTRCRDRQEYLLYPNHGRRLDDVSRATVEAHARAGAGPDVQVLVGDGLSPNAIVENGASTLDALRRALQAAGLRTGVDYYVRFARIGVADEVGVLARARSSVILVGERPGLGTGDSLSLYLAVGPRLDQDNAEKNCISNVRPIGIRPEEAGSQAVAILKRALELGVGGVALGLGWGRQ
ncbi:MAG: ethanolamine ammonia-lyase subunit EutC [Deltaproteobacteria bacterium]|nr:ethanolamine ammonia-lyase subunit EutC [Deltaproteobacteria bacterium]